MSATDKGRIFWGHILESIERIEKHADTIYVRERIDGEFRNVSLLELPTDLAIKHICWMLRTVVIKGEPL